LDLADVPIADLAETHRLGPELGGEYAKLSSLLLLDHGSPRAFLRIPGVSTNPGDLHNAPTDERIEISLSDYANKSDVDMRIIEIQ
jgi:hypothetical protein